MGIKIHSVFVIVITRSEFVREFLAELKWTHR